MIMLMLVLSPEEVFGHGRVTPLNVVLVALDTFFHRRGIRSRLQQRVPDKRFTTCMIGSPPALVLHLLFGCLLSVLFHLGLPLLISPLSVVHHLSQLALPFFSSLTITLFST